MKRRSFLTLTTSAGCSAVLMANPAVNEISKLSTNKDKYIPAELSGDVIVVGGGLGGCATALAACRNGLNVIMTDETDWIGGQLSQQGVPPDENPWIETHGAPASYRDFRNRVRAYYKRNYPLTADALNRKNLNPGDGSVSRICHEPKVAVSVLIEMLALYMSSGKLTILCEYKAISADVDGDVVKAVQMVNLINGDKLGLSAPYFVDATECGDLLPLTKTEYITGSESKSQTRELHAAEIADPENNQAFTVCFAMDYQPEANNVIDCPKNYGFWSNYVPELTPAWPGKLLGLTDSDPVTLQPRKMGFRPDGKSTNPLFNLWDYRRIINKNNFVKGTYDGDIVIVNWPQNDYLLGNLIDVSDKEFQKNVTSAKQLNLSLLYWLQTSAPRTDGGLGWPGLRLRGDVMGTEDGMAKYPYIRESRRIKALFTILEEHVGAENRKLVVGETEGKKAIEFYDSVGIGYYHIDLHPSTKGNNYLDIDSLPFQIPLGALLPQRVSNLLPANKNIGTTHITNGCYRLHPTEWSIGEAVGMLISFAKIKKLPVKAIRESKELLSEFQEFIRGQGLETHWRI